MLFVEQLKYLKKKIATWVNESATNQFIEQHRLHRVWWKAAWVHAMVSLNNLL